MNNFKFSVAAILACILTNVSLGQGRIGEWKDHFDFRETRSIAILGSRVYAASAVGIFYLDQADNSIKKITQIDGLSDINIALIAANPDRNELLVAYVNGNLDIIREGVITNFASIKNSTAIGDKEIRHVNFVGNRAYLSTGLGILNFDLDRIEVSDTYTINDGIALEVNSTIFYGNLIYAATEDGLFTANANDDLTIGLNWQQSLDIPFPFSGVDHLIETGGLLFINQRGVSSPGVYASNGNGNWVYTVGTNDVLTLKSTPAGMAFSLGYSNTLRDSSGFQELVSFSNYGSVISGTTDITADAAGNIWMADRQQGLVKRSVESGLFEFIFPDGPFTNRCFDLDFEQDRLWLTTGATENPGTWNNFFVLNGFSTFSDGSWRAYNTITDPSLLDQLFFDAVKVYPHPKKEGFAWVGSYFSGFAEVENGEIARYLSDVGTSLQGRTDYEREDDLEWVGVAGFALDDDENLWVSNSLVQEPLSVRTADNVWKSFDLLSPTNQTAYQGLGTNKQLLDLIIDRQGQKWAIVNKAGIVVFDEGESIADESDDLVRRMVAEPGGGGLPSNEVLAIAEDLDGEIWVATRSGMAVFYSPFDALAPSFSDARQILVEQDGVFQFLFEGQEVTSIAIDGANRKWVGTFNNGAFLLSEDGTEEIVRFNTSNSPLPSNTIRDIAIDPKSGAVYIATAEGLMSYLSDAIQGQTSNSCSIVYPNPVRENYTGPISISGLVRDSEVRITDTRGNLIFATQANGGRAIWDGRNANGQRVATGVYFALVADVEGGSECVSKILVIK